MRGTLENPPIVIQASRLKSLGYLLIGATFVAMGILIVRDNDAVWVGWLCIAFFGFVCLVFVLRLLVPPTLTLSPEGVRCFTGFKTFQYAWSDIDNFRVFQVPGSRLSRAVGFDFTSAAAKRPRLSRLNKEASGSEGSFGLGWEIAEAALVDLLNVARSRWLSHGH